MAKGMTKSDFISTVAEKSGLAKKDVAAALDAIAGIAAEELKKSGELTIPGLVKLTTVHKPAKPEHEGIDPFTKQPKVFKAKPASTAVKARPVKVIKDAVA